MQEKQTIISTPYPLTHSLRLLILSLLANENPYLSNVISNPHSGEPHIPQQEVLLTLQDWLWHKLITIFGMYKNRAYLWNSQL